MGSNYTYNNVTDNAVITNTSINSASIITVGAIGRNGSVGNVTNATLNTVNASLSGNTLNIGSGSNEGVSNFPNVSVAYNDFAAGGVNETKNITGSTATATAFYSYLGYGDWFECTGCNTANEVGVTGGFVYGLATDPAAIPTIGTATYIGVITGLYTDATGKHNNTDANLSSTANFATRSVSFVTTGSTVTNNLGAGISNTSLNMTGNLSYSAGSNQFTGAVTATGLSGTATGKFFGPTAQEIGGVYTLQGTAGQHDGVFVGK